MSGSLSRKPKIPYGKGEKNTKNRVFKMNARDGESNDTRPYYRCNSKSLAYGHFIRTPAVPPFGWEFEPELLER